MAAVSGRVAGKRRDRATIAPVAPMQLAGATGDEALAKLERGMGELADALNAGTSDSYLADHDLIVGLNTINHGLGRIPAMVYVAPSAASASFGVGWDPKQPGNPRPEAIVQLTVTGVPMTARVEVR